jgi:hypothetical protein
MGDAISSPFSAAFGRYSRTLIASSLQNGQKTVPPPTPKAK